MKKLGNEDRNNYVRKQLTSTLIKLLKTKKIDEISVSELTSKAGVGRVSFYRNYESIKDILKQESNRLMKESNTFSSVPNDSSYFSFFDFLKDNQKFYTTLVKSDLSDILLDSIIETANIDSNNSNLEAYLKSFWAYGLYGWICEWINRGMKESSKEIFELFKIANNK